MAVFCFRERFLSLNQRQFTTENTESTEFLRGFLCGLRALCGEKELKKQSLRDNHEHPRKNPQHRPHPLQHRGTAAVSTNHIAEAAGISPGNLYYHFHNKEEIIRELFERSFAATDAGFELPEDAAPTLADLHW